MKNKLAFCITTFALACPGWGLAQTTTTQSNMGNASDRLGTQGAPGSPDDTSTPGAALGTQAAPGSPITPTGPGGMLGTQGAPGSPNTTGDPSATQGTQAAPGSPNTSGTQSAPGAPIYNTIGTTPPTGNSTAR